MTNSFVGLKIYHQASTTVAFENFVFFSHKNPCWMIGACIFMQENQSLGSDVDVATLQCIVYIQSLTTASESRHICAGWSEPMLVAHTTLLEITCRGSINLYLLSLRSNCLQCTKILS